MSEDRVSEFGFRIHGDLDDDDDDPEEEEDRQENDDLEGLVITIPDGPVVFDPKTGMMRSITDDVSSSLSGFICPQSSKKSPICRGKLNMKSTVPSSDETRSIFAGGMSMQITETEKKPAKKENWLPDKTPEYA
ncbi:hypothetical protein Ciccas_006292 [Cichlidogyrus casuarinus]|uniref:Uncharacterized protein n=1 Tax=Cichlidogyrus casuarinus TaxID=1844966 RepID=A0ABD2Q672_9PLAT